MEKVKNLVNACCEKAEDFADDHPNVALAAMTAAYVAVAIPFVYACYKFEAKIVGREVAKAVAGIAKGLV